MSTTTSSMIIFNVEYKPILTLSECCEPAMKIRDKAEGEQYLKDYTAYLTKLNVKPKLYSGMSFEEIAINNLVYYAGNLSEAAKKRAEKFFKSTQPKPPKVVVTKEKKPKVNVKSSTPKVEPVKVIVNEAKEVVEVIVTSPIHNPAPAFKLDDWKARKLKELKP